MLNRIAKPETVDSCHRCSGLGTIPTPDGKHNEICPICGGSGKRPGTEKEWRR